MQKNTAGIEKIIANLAVKDYSASINRLTAAILQLKRKHLRIMAVSF